MFAGRRFIHIWRLLLLIVFSFEVSDVSAQSGIQPEHEILLELRLDGEKLGLDILGYQQGEDFLLSLGELANGLGFPITIDPTEGSARGWYISEGREFSLDLRKAEVISGNKRWTIANGEVEFFQNDIYVNTKSLEKWFPLHLTTVLRELYIDVEPVETLPIQLRANRRERGVARSTSNTEPKHPLQATPYRFIGPHTTRLRLGYSTVRQTPSSDAEYGINYASLSRGDLGWMSSTLSLAGQSEDSLTNARLKLERTEFKGPMGLNHVELGDVSNSSFRGISVRGGDGRSDAESVDLEGNQLPDWDVELYQNDQFVRIETVGQDGRYQFLDIPLQFGENRFELRFFGPNGEVDTLEETYFLGTDMLEQGQTSYEMSAVQSGRTVLGVNSADGEGDRDSGIYTGNFSLGLSRNLTLGAGLRSIERGGNRLDFHNVTIGVSNSFLYGSVQYLDAPNAQNSVNTALRTRLGNTGLSLGYTRFFDSAETSDSMQRWQSSINVTSTVFSAPIKLEANAQEQVGSRQFGAVLGTTLSLYGTGQLSSSLWYGAVENTIDDSSTNTSRAGGQTSFYAVIKPWTFRFSASYGFKPDRELLNLNVDSSLRIDSDLKLNLNIRRSPLTDTTYYGAGINWQLPLAAIGAQLSYDSKERWGGLITLSTALLKQPETFLPRLDSRASVDAGSIEVQVFEDVDGVERRPQKNVDVRGIQAWRDGATDENGIAYLARMPAHRRVDIELEESTLAESELRSRIPGVSVISRPGSYTVVEFPIVRTAELEGHVMLADGDASKPVSRALVLLKTPGGELVTQRRTAFDGFYLFDGIEPGTYSLSLEDALEKRIISRPKIVKVQNDSGVIRELDFSLRDSTTTATSNIREDTPIKAPDDSPDSTTLKIPARVSQEEEVPAEKKTADGTWFVQLGAYGSTDLAEVFWERAKQNTQLLWDQTPRLARYKNMTRLLVGPGRSREAAGEFCQKLKTSGLDCFIQNLQ